MRDRERVAQKPTDDGRSRLSQQPPRRQRGNSHRTDSAASGLCRQSRRPQAPPPAPASLRLLDRIAHHELEVGEAVLERLLLRHHLAVLFAQVLRLPLQRLGRGGRLLRLAAQRPDRRAQPRVLLLELAHALAVPLAGGGSRRLWRRQRLRRGRLGARLDLVRVEPAGEHALCSGGRRVGSRRAALFELLDLVELARVRRRRLLRLPLERRRARLERVHLLDEQVDAPQHQQQ
mmetsp:Transcript_45805/g.148938  ORF Transcript_45805/g.148938 Transcript_45805/m.148938 type:complete len:233 (+) Transcript_45805:109-807(+)